MIRLNVWFKIQEDRVLLILSKTEAFRSKLYIGIILLH